jgi:hypothetical protein
LYRCINSRLVEEVVDFKGRQKQCNIHEIVGDHLQEIGSQPLTCRQQPE